MPPGEPSALRVVGADLPRKDAVEKVTGVARYAADVRLPGMLCAKVLRSPLAHARITRLDSRRAAAVPGVAAVLTRDDLGGLNPTYGYFIKDQPIVAIDRVRYVGDVVAAVAAVDEATACAALERIDVEYEPLPVVAGIAAALAGDAPPLFDAPQPGVVPAYGIGARAVKEPRKNVCYRFAYTTGSRDAFDGCDRVFEDTFVYSRSQHFHLEPFVSVAQWLGDQLEVWTSCQNPFPLRKELARVLNHPEQKIRVHVPYVGGGFGAKNNCKAEPIAVLLARSAGRPVRFCLTMEEGFLTQSQHAAILRLRTGVLADGTLVARESHVDLDAGAYSDASPLVAEKVGYRIAGPYRWQYIHSECDCVLTNTTPAGPFRGFGGTQTSFASESQLDMIARRLGLDPYEIRVKNLLRLGEPYVPHESGIDSDLAAGLDLVAERLGYHRRPRRRGRGMGLSVGFKDGGGVNKPAQAQVKVTTTGGVLLQCGTTEIGQGATTALAQVVAEILAAPLDRVRYAPVDTDSSPFDQGTNASSAIAVMGRAVELAAREVRGRVLEFAAARLGCAPAELTLENWTVRRGDQVHPLPPMVMRYFGGTGFEFVGHGFFKMPTDHEAPLEARCAFWEIGWGGAEVEVDEETGQIRVLQLVVSGDAGRAIHPGACRGQDEGAAVMGLGQALFERMLYDGARLVNGDALSYRVALAGDLPARFVSILQEQGHGPGPFGAKGLGEGTMLPVASAIANAVEDAVGVRLTEPPFTPERVLAALEAARAT